MISQTKKKHMISFVWKLRSTFELQLGLVLGLMLAIILGVGLQYGARLFTKDVNVLHLISIAIPVSPLVSEQRTNINFYLDLFNPKWQYEFTGFHLKPVCCCHSTHQCLGICFWRHQLWSLWFCIFSIFYGKSSVPFLHYVQVTMWTYNLLGFY